MNRIRRFVNTIFTPPSTSVDPTNVSGSNNIEISKANFLFQVPNFDKNKVTLSPTAYVRNLPWTIMIKQNEAEDGTNISISVFVMCDYNLCNNWSCDTEISLNLMSTNSSKTYRMSMEHCFRRNECVKGHDPFILWSELMDPQNGFLNNNKIVLEVIMECDEPECVPWNSKKHTRFIGLENKIENSFLNSIIQILYSIKSFRTSIESFRTSIDGLPSENELQAQRVILEMQQVFLQLNFSEAPVSIQQFIESMGSRIFNATKAHNSEHFFNFIDKLLRKHSSTKEASDLFHGQISTLSTSTGKFEITELKKLNGLKLTICEDADIDELISNYFVSNSCINELDSSTNWIEVSTLYRWFYGFIRCTNPTNDDYRTSVQFGNQIEITQLPSILILHLDRQQGPQFTIEQRKELKFCKNVNLNKFVKKHVDTSAKYVLHAALVEVDTFSAFINVSNEIGWLKFDNDIVSHCTEKEAIEDNFRYVRMLVYLRCSQMSSKDTNDDIGVQFKCIICMEATTGSDIFSTVCGHVFCGSCIKMEFSLRQKCPVCQNVLTEKDIHPIYI